MVKTSACHAEDEGIVTPTGRHLLFECIMSDNVNIEKDPMFKEMFWQWFDLLPKKDKERFWTFVHDFTSIINFIGQRQRKKTNA